MDNNFLLAISFLLMLPMATQVWFNFGRIGNYLFDAQTFFFVLILLIPFFLFLFALAVNSMEKDSGAATKMLVFIMVLQALFTIILFFGNQAVFF